MSNPRLLTQLKFSEHPDFALDIEWDCNPQHRYVGELYWFDMYWERITAWSIFDLLQRARGKMEEMEREQA